MNMRKAKLILFFAILGLGIATIVSTLAHGGTITSSGILFGGILCAMAAMRIFIALRMEP